MNNIKTMKLGDVSVHECFGHRSGGKSVAWNSMGTKLASCSSDKSAKIWSVLTDGKGKEVGTFSGHSASVEQILWTCEEIIVTSSLDKTVRLWDSRLASTSSNSSENGSSSSSSCVARIQLPSAPVYVDWHPSGMALSVLMEEQEQQPQHSNNFVLRIYDVRKSNLAVASTSANSNMMSSTNRRADNGATATTTTTTSSLQPVRTYSSLFPKSNNCQVLNQGRFSPFGYHYFAASRNLQDGIGKLHIMDCSDMLMSTSSSSVDTTTNNYMHSTLDAHTGSTNCFRFSSCGRYMATGGSDAIVGIWELREMTCVRTVDRLLRSIQSVTFSHDSKLLASSSVDESKIDIANVETGQKICDVDSLSRYGAIDMEWNPKGYALAFACYFPESKGSYGERGRMPLQPLTAAITVVKCNISNS